MIAADGGNQALVEERDQLLRSLDQLDREHESGDLDDDDHQELVEGYTVRLASVLRRLDASATPSPSAASAARSRKPKLILLAVLLVFSVGAGLLLARASGERGVRDQITGGISESSRNRVAECQEIGSTGGDLVGALACFDDLLARDAANAEALSYRGWYLLLAAGALQDSSTSTANDEDAVQLIASALSYLDRAVEADPRLPDPLAFRATVFDRLGQSDLVCADIITLRSLEPPQFFLDQTAALATRNGC